MKTWTHEHEGITVTLDMPEPVIWDDQWWETTEYRMVKKHETFLSEDKNRLWFAPNGYCYSEQWIMCRIPRATPEQLKLLGIRERDGKPVECRNGQKIWDGERLLWMLSDDPDYVKHIGRYRFVLVPSVGAVKKTQEEPTRHYSCVGCKDDGRGCFNCFPWVPSSAERKNFKTKEEQ